jgi:hypothetical protein
LLHLPLSLARRLVRVLRPGYLRDGRVITAPNLGTNALAGFDLQSVLAEHLRKPVRVLNDADVQGFGAIKGRGLEMVLTLGTGAGTALFRDGEIMPHLELAHRAASGGKTYDEYVEGRPQEERQEILEQARRQSGRYPARGRALRPADGRIKHVPVRLRSVIERLNRKLKKQGQTVYKVRGKHGPYDLGPYFISSHTAIIDSGLDESRLEELARREGVLRAWEEMTQ